MNVKTIVMWAVGLVVGAILFAGMVIPASGLYDESQSHINARTDYAKYIEADGEYVLTHEGTTRNWTLDGQPWNSGGQSATMLYSTTNGIYVAANWNGIDVTNGFSGQPTYEIKNGKFTTYRNDGTQVYQADWEGGWVRTTEKTDYVFSAGDAEKYVTMEQAANWSLSSWANTNMFFRITGNIATNELTVVELNNKAISNVSTEVIGEERAGYFVWTKILVHYTYNGSEQLVTINSVVIPEKVISTEKNDAYSSLFGVIPIIVIIALVVFAANLYRNRV